MASKIRQNQSPGWPLLSDIRLIARRIIIQC